MPPLEPHPDDAAFLEELTEVAFEVAGRLGLPLRVVEHKRRPHPGGRTGLCYWQEGRVSLVLRYRERSEWWTRPCDPVDVWCMLAHELAHLADPNHGRKFKEWDRRCRDAVARTLSSRGRWPRVVAALRTRNATKGKVMKAEDVKIGEMYAVKVSGKIAPVVIDDEHPDGGWVGTNQETGRQVRIKTARRLRDVWWGGHMKHVVPVSVGERRMLGDEVVEVVEADSSADDAAATVRRLSDGKTISEVPLEDLVPMAGADPAEAPTAPEGDAEPEGEPEAEEDEEAAPEGESGPGEATMSGLDAAAKVLEEAGEPMRCKEIVERAFEAGYWASEGKTPSATIYAAILRDMQKEGDESRFRKVGRGLFALAE